MFIHKEGYRLLFFLFLILLIINLVIYYLSSHLINIICIGISVLFFLFILSFFRRPKQKIIINNNYILAPADGKIVAIEQTREDEYFHNKRLLVSIFMSPLNVHINWFPVSGLIKYFKHHQGKYLVAWHPKSSTENERATVVIEKDDNTEILIRQVAGILARRIVSYSKPGQKILQGEELGFIKFGSRVDLLLPLNVKINVILNQKVKGNKTVIAKFLE